MTKLFSEDMPQNASGLGSRLRIKLRRTRPPIAAVSAKAFGDGWASLIPGGCETTEGYILYAA